MKRVSTLLIALALATSLWAQSPQKMSYQVVVRDVSNALVTNQKVGMQISILQGTASGTVVYTETQTPTTNANGLLSIEIGGGAGFDTIDWANDVYFIKTETDPTGGSSYTITGASQLLSVPYALHAKTADTITGAINETDPVYHASIASAITSDDTTSWNNKSEFDGDFASLYNSPNIANTTNLKTIQLNTNDTASSVSIKNDNGSSVFNVDGSGRMSGDGSGLSNVKPLINYIGGDQMYEITANYGSFNNVRSVTLSAPSNGVCFVMASGYASWQGEGWDVLLLGILCDQDPNNSWEAQDEWYKYLNILTDYNCTDATDQYASFSQHRCIPVSEGTHTFYLWANKYNASANVRVDDVNLSVMFFPTGGTGQAANAAMRIEEEPFSKKERVPNTVTGYK